MTEKEIIETKILIANIIGVPSDNVSYINADSYNIKNWFFVSGDSYNTVLFFSDKPSEDDIREEIKYFDEVTEEWENEEI